MRGTPVTSPSAEWMKDFVRGTPVSPLAEWQEDFVPDVTTNHARIGSVFFNLRNSNFRIWSRRTMGEVPL